MVEKMVKVTIGRTSGPCTDLDCWSLFPEDQIPLVKDVVAMVNSATNHKEKWFVMVGEDGKQFMPYSHERKGES